VIQDGAGKIELQYNDKYGAYPVSIKLFEPATRIPELRLVNKAPMYSIVKDKNALRDLSTFLSSAKGFENIFTDGFIPVGRATVQAVNNLKDGGVIPFMNIGENIHEIYKDEERRIIRMNDVVAREQFVRAGFPVRHSHTNADGDDGSMTPSELVEHAISNGVTRSLCYRPQQYGGVEGSEKVL
jgi:hypothetical protein